ncbi:MAG: hypothetical protein ABSF80_01170 [Chitinispirillaceae bacterium]
MHKKTLRIIADAMLFAVARGFLELVVVVYLREIYYPEGFRFPLQIILLPDRSRVQSCCGNSLPSSCSCQWECSTA